MIRGSAALKVAYTLASEGFKPDVIIGHPGWGETLYLKEIWPNASLILHAEFFYNSRGGDLGFDPEFGELSLGERCAAVSKNATLALAYAQADQLISPTLFQANTLPPAFRSRLAIVHEGVNLQEVHPTPDAVVNIGTRFFSREKPIITFASRVLEPLRGCHTFLRSLPKILDEIPDVEIIIAGEEVGTGYGPSPPGDMTWKQKFWAEIEKDVDPSRVHFVGWLSHEKLHALMSISAAHVYLTYPFVLSWSLLEAMACEALVIASDTAPVRDVIVPGDNGILVNFSAQEEVADAAISAIRRPDQFLPIRHAARETIRKRFDRQDVCLPQWLEIISQHLDKGSYSAARAIHWPLV